MHLETLFLVNFCVIFVKNDGEKHMDFSLFLNMLLHHLFAKFAVFRNARNLKNSDFPVENTYFYKISFFAFDVQRCRKLVKKQWMGRAKGLQKSMQFGC